MLTNTLKTVSYISLLAIIVPSIIFLWGRADLPYVKIIMNISTLVWFATSPFWMKK